MVRKSIIAKIVEEKDIVNMTEIKRIVQYVWIVWYVYMVSENEHVLTAKDRQYVFMIPEQVFV